MTPVSTTEDRSELTVYEIGYLVLSSIPEDSLPETVSKINKAIDNAGGTRIDGEDPFLHPLAYQMKKIVGARKYVVDEAYLGWVKFTLPVTPDKERHSIEDVKKSVEEMEEVLRFLIIKAPYESDFTFKKARKEKEEKAKAEEERNALPEETTDALAGPLGSSESLPAGEASVVE